jgi:hypothetical protein
MPNRTQEENEQLLLNVLRQAGETGLTIDQARDALSINGVLQSKSLAKKVLEHLRTRGCVRLKVGKSGVCYVVTQAYERK